MNTNTALSIIIIVFLGVTAAIVLINYLVNRSRSRAWEELASQLGLYFEPGNNLGKYPVVSGNYHGHRMLLEMVTRGYGRSRVEFTHVNFQVNPKSEIWFSIVNRGLVTDIRKMLGSRDILIGDEAFDSRFFIQGSPEIAVQRLFSDATLRQKLVDARPTRIDMKNREVFHEKGGFERNTDKLLPLFDLLGCIASAVERLE